MRRFASLGLVAAVSIGAALWSAGAQARTYVNVGIGVPGVALVAPYGLYGPYGIPYGAARYVRPYPYAYYRGVPYGYRGYAYGPRYHHGYGRPWH